MRWLVPAGIIVVLGLLAAGWPRAVPQFWLQQIWPTLFGFWQSVQQALPFPAVALLAPLITVLLLGLPLLAWRTGSRPADGAFVLVLCLTVLLAWLQLGWGLNYGREPVAQQLGLTGGTTVQQRLDLAAYLADVLAETADSHIDVRQATQASARELTALLGPLGYPGPISAEPVRVPAGLFLAFDVAGSLFPPSLEGLVDGGLTGWQQVAVGVHELTHVAGVAREDDATLLAALAGLRSGDDYARYALALDAFTRLELPPARREQLYAALPARAKADLAEAAAVRRTYRSAALSRAQSAVFGLWLRLQGSEGGVADYSLGASRLPLALETGLLP